ncbi:MAG: phosphatidate cytidylyltransferase [Pirellulales bacterium]|nr:phosphatidate cytidylyltransferase [Pirellulales bacterium]
MDANARTWFLVGGTLIALAAGTGIGQYLRVRRDATLNPALIDGFNRRIRAWWLMSSVLAAALLLGRLGATIVFGLISFWALREFVTLTPTRRGDHRALFWVFFVFTPLQYLLVGMGAAQYGLYTILIPVYAFLFVPARIAVAGDFKRFLERAAKIQAGLMICVYCLSHAPALMYLKIEGYEDPVDRARLLFFFVLITQLGDVMQYVWQRLAGRTIIAPAVSPNRTWESFLGSVGSCTLLGAALSWATPFEIWAAAVLSAIIASMGFAGGMTMSAIKRDRGVADTGVLVTGHSGVLDRIDSICFAAPIFFHLTRYFYAEW